MISSRLKETSIFSKNPHQGTLLPCPLYQLLTAWRHELTYRVPFCTDYVENLYCVVTPPHKHVIRLLLAKLLNTAAVHMSGYMTLTSFAGGGGGSGVRFSAGLPALEDGEGSGGCGPDHSEAQPAGVGTCGGVQAAKAPGHLGCPAGPRHGPHRTHQANPYSPSPGAALHLWSQPPIAWIVEDNSSLYQSADCLFLNFDRSDLPLKR